MLFCHVGKDTQLGDYFMKNKCKEVSKVKYCKKKCEKKENHILLYRQYVQLIKTRVILGLPVPIYFI